MNNQNTFFIMQFNIYIAQNRLLKFREIKILYYEK